MDDRIVTFDELMAELEFVPDMTVAAGGMASTETWELEGANPFRCEGTEAHPG